MKAVCISQPEATNIARRWRHVLAMGWETDYRGELLLCAGSKGAAPQGEEEVVLPREMALARAELQDVHPLAEQDLKSAGLKEMPGERRFAWVFGEVMEIVPFSVREREGLFDTSIGEEDLQPLDLAAYEDHLEYFNVVVVREREAQLSEIHDEFSQKPLAPKRGEEE